MTTNEVNDFKKNVRAWLLAIPGMAAHVATDRVYQGWPVKRSLPMITFDLSRSPKDEYTFQAWGGVLRIGLHAASPDVVDTMEDLILNWLQDESNNIVTTLTSADEVVCAYFGMDDSGIGPDDYMPDEVTDGYTFVTRVIPFAYAIVADTANQP